MRSYETVQVGENYLGTAVAGVGPISVAIMATENMQHYKKGIFTDDSCNPLILNHVVLVVGYEPKYWIIKNRFVSVLTNIVSCMSACSKHTYQHAKPCRLLQLSHNSALYMAC